MDKKKSPPLSSLASKLFALQRERRVVDSIIGKVYVCQISLAERNDLDVRYYKKEASFTALLLCLCVEDEAGNKLIPIERAKELDVVNSNALQPLSDVAFEINAPSYLPGTSVQNAEATTIKNS